ncbi:MAG: DUF333 domain-containing protein [Neisseria sp.]|uniref:putative hemolysin n=1 Tax=Neisseria sp. TaxID=192066 RepID=UPI0026DB30CC|nr:DUF333 domain-containing protein [Neisseria sp.]MDO4642049.1 DUF333 domain-containing protein [Neisseria sp.]
MKKWLPLASATLLLSACQGGTNEQHPVGMPNPASEYCVQQGGKLEVKKDAEGGEYALCHLPDGTVIEEWEFFRKNH